jgi:sialic acid synthase SpsE
VKTLEQLGIEKNGPPFFIADIAANHDGDLARAFKLIELAKDAGAHAAKFQNFIAQKIVSDIGFSRLGSQVAHQAKWKKSVVEVYREASISWEWTSQLREKCEAVGIEYMTSPYDFESVDHVEQHVSAYKVGSGDITWHAILAYIASKKKPVFLATGASTMREVESAVEILRRESVETVLMQCNTNYTGDVENFKHINLNVLRTYSAHFPECVLGLSDHTPGHSTVLAAISLGARVFEKHFTDDNQREGPDHQFSMDPLAWRDMVSRSTEVFLALGDGIKRVEKNEEASAVVQRRALRFSTGLRSGHLIGPRDLYPLRPQNSDGITPDLEYKLIGKVLKRDVQEGEHVRWEDLEDC